MLIRLSKQNDFKFCPECGTSTEAVSWDLTSLGISPAPVFDAKKIDFDTWSHFFRSNGYLVLSNVLASDTIFNLKRDIDLVDKKTNQQGNHTLHKAFFEHSRVTSDLFEAEPVVTLAERLIGSSHCPQPTPSSLVAHVFHNNAYVVRPGTRGQAPSWHQDDPPHVSTFDGTPFPANVDLPVLALTCLYYLTDCLDLEDGPTRVIPGSHRFGVACNNQLGEKRAERGHVACMGPAGSVVIVNCQVWHRGAAVTGYHGRYTMQVSYGRRLVGHQYAPFMNYQMPKHVFAGVSDRRKRLLGFLPHGAYG